MTNLSSPDRYDILGIPNDASGNAKAYNFLQDATKQAFPDKLSRDFPFQTGRGGARRLDRIKKWKLQSPIGIDHVEPGKIRSLRDSNPDRVAGRQRQPTSNGRSGAVERCWSDALV